MKKLFHYLSVIAIAALTLTGCDDVPMPYNQPNITPDEPVNPSGTSSLPYSDSNLRDWTPKTVKGAAWSLGNTYAKATGYNNGSTTETEAWLVSPKINTTTTVGAVITFDHVIRYVNNASDINNHEMYISSDYNDDVQTATWTKLNYKPVESSTRDWTFYAADSIQIPDEYLNKDVVIAFKFTCNDQNSTTWEVNNLRIFEGKVSGGNDTPTPTPTPGGDIKGDGTQANPYNVAAVLSLYDNNTYDAGKDVYVTGTVHKIGSIDTGNFGNATYYISDDGTSDNDFEIYRGYYFNGDKFTSESQLKVGDVVVVCGKLTMYRTTREMAQGSRIVTINGKDNGEDTPTATGLNETFAASQGNFTIENISMDESLTYVWQWNNSKYMKASAYKNKKNLNAQSRLVSPAFSLAGLSSATLTFDHTGKYFSSNKENDVRVQVSTDGSNWTDLKIDSYPTGNDWTFVTATADISAYAGRSTVYIAFLYTSTTDASATWEIKNVVVK